MSVLMMFMNLAHNLVIYVRTNDVQ